MRKRRREQPQKFIGGQRPDIQCRQSSKATELQGPTPTQGLHVLQPVRRRTDGGTAGPAQACQIVSGRFRQVGGDGPIDDGLGPTHVSARLLEATAFGQSETRDDIGHLIVREGGREGILLGSAFFVVVGRELWAVGGR